MKYCAIPLIILACACGDYAANERTQAEPLKALPELEWESSQVFFHNQSGLWKVKSDSSMASGRIVSYASDGALVKVVPVVGGKREGVQLTYFPDGRLKFQEHFSDNRLHGKVRRWSLNAGYQLVAELTYQEGKLDGLQKKWYDTGEIHKVLTIRGGKEEGLQKAFRKNGALYANYEARNGRVFGLKRSNLCYELEQEQVVYLQ